MSPRHGFLVSVSGLMLFVGHDLKVGGSLQAAGLDLGHNRLRATEVISILPRSARRP